MIYKLNDTPTPALYIFEFVKARQRPSFQHSKVEWTFPFKCVHSSDIINHSREAGFFFIYNLWDKRAFPHNHKNLCAYKMLIYHRSDTLFFVISASVTATRKLFDISFPHIQHFGKIFNVIFVCDMARICYQKLYVKILHLKL